MDKLFDQIIYYFGLYSIGLGFIQLLIGIFDYNSIFVGFKMSYVYFAVGLLFIALDKIICHLKKMSQDNQ